MANQRKATDGGGGGAGAGFSRRQLVTIAALFVIASAFIFLLGILIGQSIEERKLVQQEEPSVNVPVKPGAPGADQEMTFYDTLTRPEPAAPPAEGKRAPAAATPAPAPRDAWTIQVFAARNRSTADRMVADLKKLGYRAYVTSIEVNRKRFYRVRVGAYQTRQAAQPDLQRLKGSYENAQVTRNR